jgi:hypothetical protein
VLVNKNGTPRLYPDLGEVKRVTLPLNFPKPTA